MTFSPLWPVQCGFLDPSYPGQWRWTDNTEGQRLWSPRPLWCFWLFQRGTDGQEDTHTHTERVWGQSVICVTVIIYFSSMFLYDIKRSYFTWAVWEVQTSDVHPSFDHLLEFGNGPGRRTWQKDKVIKLYNTLPIHTIHTFGQNLLFTILYCCPLVFPFINPVIKQLSK